MRRLPLRLLALAVVALAALPFWLQLCGSITAGPDLIARGLSLLPGRLSGIAYRDFCEWGGMHWLANSLAVSTVAALGQCAVSGLAGYAFAWKRFPGRDWLFWLLVASMALPAQALLVPRFVLVRKLGLSGYPALLLVYWVATSGILLVRQFARSIPAEVMDAARMDGAGEVRLLWSVVFPALRSCLVLVAAGTFIGAWADLFWPQLLLRGDNMTLAVGLFWLSAQHIGDYGTRMTRLMAGGVVSMVPVLLVFLSAQGQLERGFTTEWE